MAVGDSDAALHDGEASWRGDASKREGGGLGGELEKELEILWKGKSQSCLSWFGFF